MTKRQNGPRGVHANTGNTYNLKFKTKAQRKKVHKALIKHLEYGLSFHSFGPLSNKQIEWYSKKYPNDFPAELIDEAYRAGLADWEILGRDAANGSVDGFQYGAWAFSLRNKYGWKDKNENTEPDQEGQKRFMVEVTVITEDDDVKTNKASK